VKINKGDRFAQAIVMKHNKLRFKEVSNLSETQRGIGGIGSTGK
jgi:dUTP pyrophosphatase